MPELVHLYIRSVVIGFAIAAVFAAGLIWQDVMGIGHLILGSDVGWIAALMLVVFNGIVFSAVQFGLRIMMMAEDDDGPKGGRKQPVMRPARIAIPVASVGQSASDARARSRRTPRP